MSIYIMLEVFMYDEECMNRLSNSGMTLEWVQWCAIHTSISVYQHQCVAKMQSSAYPVRSATEGISAESMPLEYSLGCGY